MKLGQWFTSIYKKEIKEIFDSGSNLRYVSVLSKPISRSGRSICRDVLIFPLNHGKLLIIYVIEKSAFAGFS